MKAVVLIASVLLSACSSLSGSAGSAAASHTELKDCVIQEVLPGKDMTGAFVRFVHTGEPVDLLRAEVPGVAQRVELHSMAVKDGVMEMVPLTDVRLEAGERVFKKGADHVMLFDVAQKPAIGSTHTMTIHFSDGTQASCEAVVKSVKEVMKDAGIESSTGH
ncbi:MAG: copper chaperone PCu(A)C [Lautropia sp.]|nr:copper chaperone PCu(A)C [Lautropia sp.]